MLLSPDRENQHLLLLTMYVMYARDHSEDGKTSPDTSVRQPAEGVECTHELSVP